MTTGFNNTKMLIFHTVSLVAVPVTANSRIEEDKTVICKKNNLVSNSMV